MVGLVGVESRVGGRDRGVQWDRGGTVLLEFLVQLVLANLGAVSWLPLVLHGCRRRVNGLTEEDYDDGVIGGDDDDDDDNYDDDYDDYDYDDDDDDDNDDDEDDYDDDDDALYRKGGRHK